LGPDAEIEVVANGGEGTVSQKVKADFKQTTPVLVARIVSATNTKGTLSDVDTKALEKTIELIKNQGFRTVVISNITTTIKTEGLANERIAKIKSYILAKTGNLKLTFTVVPASSRTYFNNISLM
jgi:endonuclease III